MKNISLILSILLLGLAFALPAEAADKPVRVKPSKISAAKGREREKLFSEWMKQRDFTAYEDKKKAAGEQLIYFEYHEGKDEFRGIFSKAISFNGWWYNTIYGEKEMESEVNNRKGLGYEPLFVVLEGNYYRMLFVKPDQLAAARKLLEPLGIEAPVLK